jgi:hypothetical protein
MSKSIKFWKRPTRNDNESDGTLTMAAARASLRVTELGFVRSELTKMVFATSTAIPKSKPTAN